MTRKRSDPDADEAASFKDMLEGIKPLAQTRIDPDTGPKNRPTRKSTGTTAARSVYGEQDYLAGVGSDEILSFSRNGVQQKVMIKLKKGLFPIEARVDLHGANIDTAGIKLQQTLNNALSLQQRCILVVHGRGKGSQDNKPAIKAHVNQWLRDTDSVLAFHSALPKDGGTGALYVLLKRQREK